MNENEMKNRIIELEAENQLLRAMLDAIEFKADQVNAIMKMVVEETQNNICS